MAHVSAVPPLPDVEDLWSLLAFLKDPKAVEERLTALENLRTEIDAKIEAVGKAEDIDRLLIQAQSDRQMAREALADARRDAEVIVREAREWKERAEAKAGQAEAELALAAETFTQQRRAWEIEQMTREHAASEALKTATAKEAHAAAMREEAERIRGEFADKLAKLKSGLAAVSG